eukprot:TRINITY_DN12521_c2_g1_i4.p2 TRINITY_DN12521_c2_g1~~TRINITY_DN12521_c2_g1_i4.p2  ORF type:complete len:197 (+),score=33.60 TRINITY_DN12521_c2_g1_i4:254-844(+)
MSPFRSILAKMAAAAAKAIKDSNQNLLSIAVREDAIAAYKENQSSDEPIPAINNEHSMSITNVRDKANEAAYRNASVQADKDMKLCFIKTWLFQALGKEHVEFMELGTVDELFDYYKKQLSDRCRPNLSTCVDTLTKLKAIQLYSGQNDVFINQTERYTLQAERHCGHQCTHSDVFNRQQASGQRISQPFSNSTRR